MKRLNRLFAAALALVAYVAAVSEALAWTYPTTTLSAPTGTVINGSAGMNVCPVVTPAITASAYAQGNIIGGLQPVTFFIHAAPPTGMLDQFMISWVSANTTPVTVYIFSKTPATTLADRVTPTWNNNDMKYLVTPPFTLTGVAPSVGTSATSAAQSMSVSVQNDDGTTTQNLYVVLVAGAAFTPAVGDLVFRLCGVSD